MVVLRSYFAHTVVRCTSTRLSAPHAPLRSVFGALRLTTRAPTEGVVAHDVAVQADGPDDGVHVAITLRKQGGIRRWTEQTGRLIMDWEVVMRWTGYFLILKGQELEVEGAHMCV
jgi:hypothetical protein